MTAGIECSETTHATDFLLIAQRNNSLSSTERFLVFAFLFVVSIGIACAFAAFGAWLVLPFASNERCAAPGPGARAQAPAAECSLVPRAAPNL